MNEITHALALLIMKANGNLTEDQENDLDALGELLLQRSRSAAGYGKSSRGLAKLSDRTTRLELEQRETELAPAGEIS